MSRGGPGSSAERRPVPWAVIQHVGHEGPGLIGRSLAEAGVPFEVVRTDLGHQLPDASSLGGLVVMGGPMGVDDGTDHPWLSGERDLIGVMARSGKPVLGVCLGAQQLAAALGAEVTTGPSPEIGDGEVTLTGAGRHDPVLGPEYGGLATTTIPCVHWHHDTFGLPEGAVHLAATRLFPHQAFRWGKAAYGLQFHVEVDGQLAGVWAPYLPEGMVLEPSHLARVETVGRRLLRRFVALSLSVGAGPVDNRHVDTDRPAAGGRP